MNNTRNKSVQVIKAELIIKDELAAWAVNILKEKTWTAEHWGKLCGLPTSTITRAIINKVSVPKYSTLSLLAYVANEVLPFKRINSRLKNEL